MEAPDCCRASPAGASVEANTCDAGVPKRRPSPSDNLPNLGLFARLQNLTLQKIEPAKSGDHHHHTSALRRCASLLLTRAWLRMLDTPRRTENQVARASLRHSPRLVYETWPAAVPLRARCDGCGQRVSSRPGRERLAPFKRLAPCKYLNTSLTSSFARQPLTVLRQCSYKVITDTSPSESATIRRHTFDTICVQCRDTKSFDCVSIRRPCDRRHCDWAASKQPKR